MPETMPRLIRVNQRYVSYDNMKDASVTLIRSSDVYHLFVSEIEMRLNVFPIIDT